MIKKRHYYVDHGIKDRGPDFIKFIVGLRQKKHMILCGNLHVTHQNMKAAAAGFTDQESKEFQTSSKKD